MVRSVARHGPRRFYVPNTGVSTAAPLRDAADALEPEGIALRFTDLAALLEQVQATFAEQEGGTHADEIETSMLLAIAPERVAWSAR